MVHNTYADLESFIDQSLMEIERGGWARFRPLSPMGIDCSTRLDFILLLEHALTLKMKEAVSTEEFLQASPRERVLEIFLQRFEGFSAHRKAFKMIANDLVFWSTSALKFKKALAEEFRLSLQHAAISVAGPIGCSKVLFLSGLYSLMRIKWLRNDQMTEEQLMAQIDLYLTWADRQMQLYA